jgi:hypothetical protein
MFFSYGNTALAAALPLNPQVHVPLCAYRREEDISDVEQIRLVCKSFVLAGADAERVCKGMVTDMVMGLGRQRGRH